MSQKASTADKLTPDNITKRVGNNEVIETSRRARATGGVRGTIIREIVYSRVDIADAETFSAVINRLTRIAGLRESIGTAGKVRSIIDAGSVGADALKDGIKQLNEAAKVAGHNDENLTGLALELKDKAGQTLLEEHLPRARKQVEDLLAKVFFEHGVSSGALLSPQAVSENITAVRKSLGGNGPTSDKFFQKLIDDGEYQDQKAINRAMLDGKGSKHKINAAYQKWLREQALDLDPGLQDDLDATEQVGKEIIEMARKAAGLTPREVAQKVGRNIDRGENLRGVTSRSGWSAKDYDKDMVELMQIAGKAMPADAKVKIGSLGDIKEVLGVNVRISRGRSFHIEGDDPGIGRVSATNVCLAGKVDKGTLFHEVGHAIEAVNPVANAAVSRWLRGRVEGKDTQSLRSLTGIGGYKRGEVAVKDDFIDPYVGKAYKPRKGIQSNEVLAMGLERLADPAQAANLAARDPDHLALVLSVLQMEYQP